MKNSLPKGATFLFLADVLECLYIEKSQILKIILILIKVEKAKRKRIIISSIYSGIVLLIALGIYVKHRPVPTCSDGIKNQNEENVDCGGVCAVPCSPNAQNLVIGKMGVVPSGIAGKYDFYVRITNPNATFGDKNFYYKLDFKDAQGKIITTRNGSSYILPGEQKYIVESNIDASEKPTAFNFNISSSDWVEFNSYYEAPDIQVVNKNYSEISGGVGFSEASGLLKNKSPYDFDLIKIEIILTDNNGNVLALNSTQMNTVISGEQRDFNVAWPNSFPGTVGNMETQTEVNVFSSDTFMKRAYKAEKFQQY